MPPLSFIVQSIGNDHMVVVVLEPPRSRLAQCLPFTLFNLNPSTLTERTMKKSLKMYLKMRMIRWIKRREWVKIAGVSVAVAWLCQLGERVFAAMSSAFCQHLYTVSNGIKHILI